ncbi:Uncharacterized protein Adt_31140 [Abeliophyllum distichum]|uniref:Uncharacterized protein n=1 Tax=Abeliophyllum distichum TaxID=126358 RepID=A0ABD1RGT1_9LAMI
MHLHSQIQPLIPLELPLWPQLYPYGPSHMMRQNIKAASGLLPQQSQKYVGRPKMPSQQSQVWPTQIGLAQPYAEHSYTKSTVLGKLENPLSEKSGAVREVGSSSQKMVEEIFNIIGCDKSFCGS